jgi:c-di-GMP-binding flagellar brake protein YcgR
LINPQTPATIVCIDKFETELKMPKGDMYIEKRKHKRAQTKLSVTYKVMANDEFEPRGPETDMKRKVESEDISTSGMQLICDEEIAQDKVVRLDVSLNGAGGNIATFAEVKWVRRDDALRKFRVGLQFLVIKEDHIAAIRKMTGE